MGIQETQNITQYQCAHPVSKHVQKRTQSGTLSEMAGANTINSVHTLPKEIEDGRN